MKRIRIIISLFVLLATLAACGEPVDGDGSGAASGTTTTSITTETSETSTTVDTGDVDVIKRAIEVLSSRLRVDASEIEVISDEAVTWSDGSMGCPEPGKLYTQALVPGHRVVLGHGERVYVFHSGADDEPFLCESDEKDGGYDFVPPPREG